MFFLAPFADGETDIKEAIIGKWEKHYDAAETFTLEFFRDGSISAIFSAINTDSTGNEEPLIISKKGSYRLIDGNRIRIDIPGGALDFSGPIVCGVSIAKDELILTKPNGEVEKYIKVMIETGQKLTEEREITTEEKKVTISDSEVCFPTKEFKTLPYFLGTLSGDVLKCPREKCDIYEKEAAKELISHLLTIKGGKWLGWSLTKEMVEKIVVGQIVAPVIAHILAQSDLSELLPHVYSIVKGTYIKVNNKISKNEKLKPMIYDLNWKNIWAAISYCPYEKKGGRHLEKQPLFSIHPLHDYKGNQG